MRFSKNKIPFVIRVNSLLLLTFFCLFLLLNNGACQSFAGKKNTLILKEQHIQQRSESPNYQIDMIYPLVQNGKQ